MNLIIIKYVKRRKRFNLYTLQTKNTYYARAVQRIFKTKKGSKYKFQEDRQTATDKLCQSDLSKVLFICHSIPRCKIYWLLFYLEYKLRLLKRLLGMMGDVVLLIYYQ